MMFDFLDRNDFLMLDKLDNKRLLTCAELLAEVRTDFHGAAVDVGTDHGYLACWLVRQGISRRAIAADINVLPLRSAERTVAQCGLQDRVSTVLSDGLDNVDNDGVTEIICAGMGGELIADILSRHEWVKSTTLILQPMTKADKLRRWLYENGFSVQAERACRDGRFVYTVMRAVYDPQGIDYECDDRYLAVGRITPDTPDSEDYIRITAERIGKAACGMLRGDGNNAEGKRRLMLSRQLFEEIGVDK